MIKRTQCQKEANELDLEIFRLVERIEQFAEAHSWCKRERQAFIALSREINSNRFHVRKYMHTEDREATQ